MKIAFAKSEMPAAGAIVVGALDDRKLAPPAATLDRRMRGALGRALAASRFKGKPDELLAVLAPAGLQAARVVLVGLGKVEELDDLALQAIGGRIVAHLNAVGETRAALAVDDLPGAKLSAPQMAAGLAYGARLRSYRFDRYRTTEKPESKPSLKRLTVMLDAPAAARRL